MSRAERSRAERGDMARLTTLTTVVREQRASHCTGRPAFLVHPMRTDAAVRCLSTASDCARTPRAPGGCDCRLAATAATNTVACVYACALLSAPHEYTHMATYSHGARRCNRSRQLPQQLSSHRQHSLLTRPDAHQASRSACLPSSHSDRILRSAGTDTFVRFFDVMPSVFGTTIGVSSRTCLLSNH